MEKTMAEKLRSAYIPHKPVRAVAVGPSMTKQSMADESNINLIMARYVKTGIIEHVKEYGAHYADMPSLTDFHEAMNLVTEAQQMFDELPAETRSDFRNDPAEFLDFVTNPENHEAMVEMGLAHPREPPAQDTVPEVPETPETPPAAPQGDPDPV